MEYEKAFLEIKQIISQNNNILDKVTEYLYNNFDKYSWVGIYLVEDKNLILGPWKGKKATEHTKIPIGKGICGSAAKTGKTEIIRDVSKDNRYLSCFISTKSEIVVPIKSDNNILGEIDIDADIFNAFDKNDSKFLEKVADMLAEHIK